MVIFNLSAFSSAHPLITEIELNPAGPDSGNEWIKLHSLDSIDLSGYSIKNSDSSFFDLSGPISNYKTVKFESQFLDNQDEKIFLLYNNEKIQETPYLSDTENTGSTWNFCNSKWSFISSNSKQNSCFSETNNITKKKTGDNPILLNSPAHKELKSKKDSKNILLSSDGMKQNYLLLSFCIFLISIIVLLSLNKL